MLMGPNGNGGTPVEWGNGSWELSWVKRHGGRVSMVPGFEAGDVVVVDVRECFSSMAERGRAVVKEPYGERSE